MLDAKMVSDFLLEENFEVEVPLGLAWVDVVELFIEYTENSLSSILQESLEAFENNGEAWLVEQVSIMRARRGAVDSLGQCAADDLRLENEHFELEVE